MKKGEAHHNKHSQKSSLRKKALKFGIYTGLFAALIGFSLYGAKLYYKGRIYPLVKIGAVKVYGMKTDQAQKEIEKYYSPKRLIKLTYQGSFLELTQEEIGAKINVGDAIINAYAFGRNNYSIPNIDLSAQIDHKKLNDQLSTKFSEVEKPAKDAKFYLGKQQDLAIEPDESGTAFNIPLISQAIGVQLLEPGIIETEVITKTAEPTVSQNDLLSLKTNLEKMLNSKFYIKVDARSFYPEKSDLLAFIKPSIVEGEPQIAADSSGIEKYVESLYKKTFMPSKPDIYFTSGELSEQGVDGKAIDKEEAKSLISKAVEDKFAKPVFLVSSEVAKTKKTIEKPFTPGMYEGKYIEIDLSTQTLYQFEGQNMVGSHRVSTGKWSMPTPVGTFSINSKNPRAYSSTYDLYMPYWMAFIGSKYGIHELPEWANGKKEGESHLGTPVSHGCIRLGIGDAQAVYDWADVGTKVYIHK